MSKHIPESFFNMTDYRTYLQSWAESKGRGEFRRIAEALGVHTSLVSQICNGKKSFTEEQASSLAAYMGLNMAETDYFLKLVQLERAGTENLRLIYRRQIQKLQNEATEIKSRVPESEQMSEPDRAIFYSSWHYAAVRLMTSMSKFQSREKIAAALNVSLSRVQEVLDFLISRGLCKEQHGNVVRTSKNTHVEAGSPLAIRHHQNWRSRLLELQEHMDGDDLVLTAPLAIDKKDIPKVRKILLQTISDVTKLVDKSGSEEIVYLGMDWIRLLK